MRVREKFFRKQKITQFGFLLALSLAASMFESNGRESENLSETNTELYILGIKYKTPNGK
jgi:hypothetical protein